MVIIQLDLLPILRMIYNLFVSIFGLSLFNLINYQSQV